jgi:molybdopterin converting factor subunit 1
VRVEVRLFAVTRQLAGRATVVLEVPEGASVRDLRRLLASDCPELAALMPHVMIAVGTEFARDDAPIPPGAEVAVIPPVSGGAAIPEDCLR